LFFFLERERGQREREREREERNIKENFISTDLLCAPRSSPSTTTSCILFRFPLFQHDADEHTHSTLGDHHVLLDFVFEPFNFLEMIAPQE
jgi:hypothetical protein